MFSVGITMTNGKEITTVYCGSAGMAERHLVAGE